MKMWSLDPPVMGDCAQFYVYAREGRLVGNCRKCGRGQWKLPNHIEGKWDECSDKICDFTFAYANNVLKVSVADELLKHFSGFEKGEVRMPELSALMRPKQITKRSKKRIWLPYDGPPVCYMRITREVDLHPLSTVELESSCEECGIVYHEFVGIEDRSGNQRTPRQRGKGLFVEQAALDGCDFFRPKNTGLTLCTDRAKNFILERGYSNIEFLEVGDLIPPRPD